MSRLNSIFRTVACVLVAFVVTSATAEEKKPPKITYDEHVKPILQQKCFSCHNQDKKSSDLDLTSYSALMAGGASGEVVIPGESAASYLYELVTHESEPIMPPESPKIPDPMIETLRKWIDGGLLENAGSKAKVSKKKKYDLALAAPSTERPSVVPMPGRLSLQPHTQASAKTAVNSLATSPWAPLVAVGGHKEVLLYNTQSLEMVGTLAFPEGTPRVLKFSRSGGLLLAGGGVGGASGRVVVWNIRSGERIIEIGSELDEILAADISSDQTLIALGGPQRIVRIFSTETGSLMHEIRKHTDWVTAMEFSPDSVLLATGDRNGGLFVWEGWTGREYLTLKGHTKSISSVSWRSDSNILASSSEDTTIKLWEMENGGQVKSWGGHGGGASSVEFTRDGRLFSTGRDKVAKLWDQNGAQQRAFEAFADLALRGTYCNETNRAIAGDWTGEIRVWNAADGNRLGALSMSAPTLEQRLAEATQLVSVKQNEYNPVAESYKVAQAAFDKARTDFEKAQQVAAQAKQNADAAATALAAAKEVFTKATSEHTTVSKQVETMAKGVPMLKEAAEKAAAAASQLPDDAQLANAAKALQTSATGKQAELDKLRKTAAEKTAALQQAQQAMTTAQATATETANKLTVAQQEQQKLMPLVQPAQEKATAAKQSFDQATAALASAQQLVSRWNDEIAFAKRINELTTQRNTFIQSVADEEGKQAELDAVAAEAAAALATASADLAAGKTAFESSQEAYKVAVAEVEKAKQAQVAAAQAKVQATATVTQLQQLLAKLQETSAKANEAVELAKEDQQVAAAVATWKALIDAKSKMLGAANEDLVAKTKAEQDAVMNVAAKEKGSAGALAAQQAAEKKVKELTAAVPPLQQKATETRQAAEAAAKIVAEVQQKLDEVRKTIAVAQGLEPAA